MSSNTTAGSTLQLSAAAPSTFNQAGYAALSYTTLGEITDFGEFGRKYNIVKNNPVATRGTVKKKGSFDEGALALKLNLDTDDAGQILAKTALNSDSNYSVKITTQNGDVYYFQVLVTAFVVGLGGVDNTTGASIDMEITTSSTGVGIVEVLA